MIHENFVRIVLVGRNQGVNNVIFQRDLLCGPGRHIRKEWTESLRHRRVRENGVAEPPIWQVCQHRRLHRGHDLAGLGANHREAENEVVAPADKSLHETLCFVRRLCSQHRAHRQLRDPRGDALALRFAFAQSHVGQWRVCEQAVWTSRSRVLRFPPAKLSLMIESRRRIRA